MRKDQAIEIVIRGIDIMKDEVEIVHASRRHATMLKRVNHLGTKAPYIIKCAKYIEKMLAGPYADIKYVKGKLPADQWEYYDYMQMTDLMEVQWLKEKRADFKKAIQAHYPRYDARKDKIDAKELKRKKRAAERAARKDTASDIQSADSTGSSSSGADKEGSAD